MKVVVIGGGPAGMLAAIGSAQNGNEVTILEKMDMLGKKLLITGKGRCNITSNLPIEDFIKNIPGNGMFMYSSFNNFDNNDIIELLHEEGVETKVERGNRVFPVSDKSYDVQKALIKRLKKLNVNIILNAKVEEILVNNEKEAYGVVANINGEKNKILTDKVIIATGGKSYQGTGSTGDGYLLLQRLGHTCPFPIPYTTSARYGNSSLNPSGTLPCIPVQRTTAPLSNLDLYIIQSREYSPPGTTLKYPR